jgi:periplasmic divalent cation tolerance protein
MPDIIQIVTTIDDREAAERLGRSLVDRRLVACCQVVGPIRSIYRWKGKVEETDEWYCVMKTRATLYERVEEAIRGLHPYEVPEIVATAVSRVLPGYAGWVDAETS